MGRPPDCCHYAVAPRSGTSTKASFRRSICYALLALALFCDPSMPWADSPMAIWAVGAPVQTASVVPLAASSFPLSVEENTPPKGVPASSGDEDNEGGLFHSIPYADCAFPLVVGGEIVRCEGEAASTSSVSYPIGGVADSLGPLLNQFFSMEVSPDVLQSLSLQRASVQAVESENTVLPSDDIAEGKGRTISDTSSQKKKGVSVNPHFIRIFGRWVPFSRGLHLWLDTDVTTGPLRRLSSAPADAAEFQQNHSMEALFQLGLESSASGSSLHLSKGPYPFVYWQHSAISLSVQNLCIALIKLPIEKGSTSPPFRDLPTTHVPESCKEAHQLVSSEGSSPEPSWLSCGPQLELSKMTHFLTFSVSQEKINHVLAALDYSVEIWRERRETHPHSGRKGRPEGVSKTNKRTSNESASETAQKQVPSVPAGTKPEIPAARDVEARRLAAREDPPGAPAKWRVGVCLLKKPPEAAKDRNTGGSDILENPQDVEQREAAERYHGDVSAGNSKPNKPDAETGGEELTPEAKEPQDAQKSCGDGDAKLVGEIKFHVPPAVSSHADDKKKEPETIQIRHFIDAGWMYSREVQGLNLTRFNRLALKESPEGEARPCIGFWEEHSLLSVAPESYAWDETTNREKLRFVFSNSLKAAVQSREGLYNSVPGRHATSRMHVCFYTNDEEPYGLLLGEVQFVIDSADATLLVFFILFVFLAIPVTCAVAISFHVYKHRHLRERLQRLALVQQRDAVEQLLMRELGLNREEQEDADDDEDDEESHA